jgi:hydroxymethylglutaryl-CoA reductase
LVLITMAATPESPPSQKPPVSADICRSTLQEHTMASNSGNSGSRIPDFFRLPVRERIEALESRGLISAEDARRLLSGGSTLKVNTADRMIENVIGVHGLPFGIALNFLINHRDTVVPLVVEEPSIVAGLSGAARSARAGGGFFCNAPEPVLSGQVQIVGVEDTTLACNNLLSAREQIIAEANSLHPNMVRRGGGALDVSVDVLHAQESGGDMVVLYLHVDTRDAMGANLVNTMCEGIAPLIASVTGGRTHLRILSNLSDRSIVTATVRFPVAALETKGFSGEQVRDGIVLANDLALADPYRAATHNKGIMNGVDAVAIATGNDWRAIEAAAHAYAARDGRYRGLTRWYRTGEGDLAGEIRIPMKVGTVGGSLETNPMVRISHHLLGSPSAPELAGIMGVVGLAQNFAALRSLSTRGIQANHMKLHARSVASTAGVPDHLFDKVVDALVESGEIKVWKAERLVADLQKQPANEAQRVSACGKVILLGEHAVVYGQPAFAAPLPIAIEANAVRGGPVSRLTIAGWNHDVELQANAPGFGGALFRVMQKLIPQGDTGTIRLFPHVPPGMGLGGSAAMAVASLRAISEAWHLGLDNDAINAWAFELETAAHGSPSGVDNTVATFGRALRFQRGATPPMSFVEIGQSLPLVIGLSGEPGSTAQTVAAVRARHDRDPGRYQRLFAEIGSLTDDGILAAKSGDVQHLGELFNVCHGLLNALGLSTPALESMIHLARSNGAAGAKLTGGGGGGAIVALAEDQSRIVDALGEAGFSAFAVTIHSAV